jgi:hypothetical protein
LQEGFDSPRARHTSARIAARRRVHRRGHLHRIRHSGFPLAGRDLDAHGADRFQDFVASAEMRKEAWRRRFAMEETFATVKPNAGHMAIAELVSRGRVSHVITQNIDNLHQDSGVPAGR